MSPKYCLWYSVNALSLRRSQHEYDSSVTLEREPCQIGAGAAVAILRDKAGPGRPNSLSVVIVVKCDLDVGANRKGRQLGKEQQTDSASALGELHSTAQTRQPVVSGMETERGLRDMSF